MQNYSGEYFQALSRYTQDVCVEFLVNQQGPKVPWVLVFFDFVGCYPDLPEWVDGKKLQHFLNQFKTRFRRFCKGKFTSYHHCMNLRDLHFGRMSGFVGLFKPVSIHKVTFLSVHSSAQLFFLVGLPLVEVLVCPVGPLIFPSLSSDHFLLSLINCAFVALLSFARGTQSIRLQKKEKLPPQVVVDLEVLQVHHLHGCPSSHWLPSQPP